MQIQLKTITARYAGLIILAAAAAAPTLQAQQLLTPAHESQLESWLGQGDLVFTKIYTRQSGHFATDFHPAVDGRGPTVTLMKVGSSYIDPVTFGLPEQIVGGYNPQSWSSRFNDDNTDFNLTSSDATRTAFIFNLTHSVIQRQNLSGQGTANSGVYQTFNGGYDGPCFGGGYDLGTTSDLLRGSAVNYSYGGFSNSQSITRGGYGSTTNPQGIPQGNGVSTAQDNFSVLALEVYTFAPAGSSGPELDYYNQGPVSFNGTTQFVDAGTAPGSASKLTVSFFATPAKLANMSVIDKLALTGTAGWSLKMRSNGDLWFRIGSEASGSRTDVIANTAYAANTRLHIACTYAAGVAQVYINGTLMRTVSGITQSVNNTTTNLRLGIPSLAATTNIYQGSLEQVRIYDDALSAADVAKLANTVIPTWKHDGPTEFDGVSTFINGGTTPGSATSLTVAAYITADKLANMSVIDKLPLTGTAGWSLKMRSNGDLWFRIGSEASGSRTDVIAPAVYSPFARVHVACTFSAGTARIYVNGALVKTTTGITRSVANTTTNLRLGVPSVAATSNVFQGELEGVKVFHTALTQAQIQALLD